MPRLQTLIPPQQYQSRLWSKVGNAVSGSCDGCAGLALIQHAAWQAILSICPDGSVVESWSGHLKPREWPPSESGMWPAIQSDYVDLLGTNGLFHATKYVLAQWFGQARVSLSSRHRSMYIHSERRRRPPEQSEKRSPKYVLMMTSPMMKTATESIVVYRCVEVTGRACLLTFVAMLKPESPIPFHGASLIGLW
nr:hypothetical protein CFP56_20505 [Quercus suber]